MELKNCLIVCLVTTALTAIAQPSPPPKPPMPPQALAPGEGFPDRHHTIMNAAAGDAAAAPTLTRFNLDFPGGTPGELVNAIQKATGRPLNAIIPAEHANVELPALRMNHVDVPRLFQALEQANVKKVAYLTGTFFGGGFGGASSSQYQVAVTSCGFRTAGTPSDDSIWYFFVEKPGGAPLVPSKACRFYSLALYLEQGLTVDDITTAIETGWKMQGDIPLPQISFHKETKLLIAVGEPSKLETIDAVLKALEPPKPKPAIIDPTTGLPLPGAEFKAKH